MMCCRNHATTTLHDTPRIPNRIHAQTSQSQHRVYAAPLRQGTHARRTGPASASGAQPVANRELDSVVEAVCGTSGRPGLEGIRLRGLAVPV